MPIALLEGIVSIVGSLEALVMGQILETRFQISLTFSIRVTEDAIQPKTFLDEESPSLSQ